MHSLIKTRSKAILQNRETTLLDKSKLRVGMYVNEIQLTRGYEE